MVACKITFKKILLFFFWLFFIAFYLCVSNHHLQASDAILDEKVIIDINEKRSKVHSYTADFIIEYRDKSQVKGNILVKGINRSKLNIYHNHTSKLNGIILSNDKIRWTYTPFMKIAIKESIAKSETESQGFINSYIDPLTTVYIDTRVENGEECYVLEAEMKPNIQLQSSYSEITMLFIRKKDGLLAKMISYDKQRKEMESWIFYNFNINTPIEDQEFVFSPPEDVRIINWTKE